MQLRAVSPEARSCKICGTPALLYGVVDFNHSCEEFRYKQLPLCAIPVYYRRCPACGFLFSDSFDDWTNAEFRQFIYNEGYAEIDPEWNKIRPLRNAKMILNLFGKDRTRLSILDYGGGNGELVRSLRENGFFTAEAYDPFDPRYSTLPDGTFNIISCFETFEHLPDPIAAVEIIVNRLDEAGLVLFSTLAQPPNFAEKGMHWWYITPRNGHISLFSRKALAVMWQRYGFTVGSFNDDMHLAFRRVPDFARHLIKN